MDDMIEINNMMGNTFCVRGDIDGNYISTMEYGYVILKDGTFVILSEDHGNSLTDFYVAYTNNQVKLKKMSTFDIIPLLSKEGLLIYIGASRKKNHLLVGDDSFGFGLIYLPEYLTDDQKMSCRKLVESNRWITNSSREKINLEFGCGVNLTCCFTKEEVDIILDREENINCKKLI